jgi:hypothetical protein
VTIHSRSSAESKSRSCGDPLARVRDRELCDLVDELDATYDDLIGRALKNGDNGIYQLAATVRSAADYLTDMRLSAARYA